jgi:hypothetical protein
MSAWIISSPNCPIESALFELASDGRLDFSIAGMSEAAAQTSDIFSGEVRFRAHIMEGFVPYFLSATSAGKSTLLQARHCGTNRDIHLAWCIEQQLAASGVEFVRSKP